MKELKNKITPDATRRTGAAISQSTVPGTYHMTNMETYLTAQEKRTIDAQLAYKQK